mmetsp:Transcript_56164/g.111632  ORF Transcript_56164/g.111632 Transcript_56164/m.111632 type:complete len:103 (+) Transcript_56164:127-435(+)
MCIGSKGMMTSTNSARTSGKAAAIQPEEIMALLIQNLLRQRRPTWLHLELTEQALLGTISMSCTSNGYTFVNFNEPDVVLLLWRGWRWSLAFLVADFSTQAT